jgi:heme-degrading monooxygenase HmoA
MIWHTVTFKLKNNDAIFAREFLAEARKLAAIPGVQKFECLKQTSQKNHFEYGLSMEFVDQPTYDAYNTHPDHVHFVQQIWIPNVEDFLELDYVVID